MTVEVIVALVTAVAGPVSVLLVKHFVDSRAEGKADDGGALDDSDPETVSQIVLQWARTLNNEVGSMKARLQGLEGRVVELERENAMLRRHTALLSSQVVDLGGEPWKMPG